MEKSIVYRGEKISYRLSGEGRPVILVHGFSEDGTIWKHQEKYLQSNFRVLVPDIPGSGASPYNRQLATMDDHADWLKAIIDAEQITDCVIIGHSMGGYIMLAFAEKYVRYLKGFGLFHSTTFPDSEEKKATRRKSIEFINQHGAAAFIQQSMPNLFSENFKKNNPGIVSALINGYSGFNPLALISYYEAMIGRPDRTHILKSFEKPVLFVIGEEDKAVSPQDSLQQSHIPQLSYIHILENAAHMGMLEKIDQSNLIAEKFLKQILF